jgi:hypothetical protein
VNYSAVVEQIGTVGIEMIAQLHLFECFNQYLSLLYIIFILVDIKA